MEYSIPYLALIVFFSILAWWSNDTKNEKIRKRLTWLALGVFLFFFGFRGFCFYDWTEYYRAFITWKWWELPKTDISDWQYEPGFMILMLTCKSISSNYFFFSFVCAAINLVLFARFLSRYVENTPLALIIYLAMGGLVMSTDLMRNSIAIMLFLNALPYLEARRPIPYFLICGVAFLFHSTSLIFIPFYFFLHRKWGRWTFLIIFLIGNVVYLMRIPMLMNIVSFASSIIDPTLKQKIDAYMEMAPGVGFQISIGYLERLFTGILVLIYYNKLHDIRKDADLFINALLIYFALFFFLSEFRVLSVRFSYLFAFGYWVIWLDLIKCFAVQNNRRLFVCFLFIYSMLKIYQSTNNVIYRYDNVIFSTESYNLRRITFDVYSETIK